MTEKSKLGGSQRAFRIRKVERVDPNALEPLEVKPLHLATIEMYFLFRLRLLLRNHFQSMPVASGKS